MSDTVNYQLTDTVATITLDDGKANVLSPVMQRNINEALDRAEQDGAKAVVLAGNSRVFSGGFDLSVFSSGDVDAALGMLTGGFELAVRVLTYPVPVIMAATGPAIAMGSFLLLCGDHRVGSANTRCQANEVAIGMVLPVSALEIMRMRLTPAAYQQAVALAKTFTGDDAIRAGWLDEIVDTEQVVSRAQAFADEVTSTLNMSAHLACKLKARDGSLQAIRAGIEGIPTEFTGG